MRKKDGWIMRNERMRAKEERKKEAEAIEKVKTKDGGTQVGGGTRDGKKENNVRMDEQRRRESDGEKRGEMEDWMDGSSRRRDMKDKKDRNKEKA